MPVVERFGKTEDDPVAIGAIVQARRAPALQTFDFRLQTVRCVAGLLAIQQRASGARDGELQVTGAPGAPSPGADAPPVSRLTTASSSGVDDDVRAALQQRQRAAADEIDLEAEEIVLGCRGALERIEVRARPGTAA